MIENTGRENPGRREVLEIAQKLIIERCLIHGLPHAIDDKKPLWIRIFWSFLLFISLGIYFYFLFLISWRFWNNPDISLNFNRRPLRELPFPAVTICTPIVTPYNGSEISSFTEGTGSFSSDLVDYIANLQWCNKEATIKALNISKTQIKDIVKIVNKSQLSLDEILFKCSYRTKPIDCSKIFTRILTENGFCFTFNMQDHSAIFTDEISKDFNDYKKEENEEFQWTIDGGFNTNSDETKPHRATKNEEIVVNLQLLNSKTFYSCLDIGECFSLYLHLPNEMISHHKRIQIYCGSYHDILISAKSYRTSLEVREYPAEVRKCYFEGEKKLKFFKRYSENMCRLECLANITLKHCNCVKFSTPRDDRSRICVNYHEIECMTETENKWKSGRESCDCMSSCNDIKYFVESHKSENIFGHLDKYEKSYESSKISERSRIKLRIFKHDIEEDLKICSYDLTNYFVDLAGLTGLFTGCSIISFIELCFFIMQRRMDRNEELIQSESSFDDFVQTSSIEGAKCFHSSESKFVKILWILIFLVSFCCLGFYIFEIYSKCKLKPMIAEEIGQIAMLEIPFPAVTICTPLFSKNLSISELLRIPAINLTSDQQSEMAANLQACSPQLASDFSQHFPLADSSQTIPYLNSKLFNINESLSRCNIQSFKIDCSRLMNYVLTDYGFCHSLNLEAFPTLFNIEVISDDFKCYRRDKLAKNYNIIHKDYNEVINDDNQSIHWTLEKGYLSKVDNNVLPLRAIRKNDLILDIVKFNESNLCPEIGAGFTLFFHMPNEILTPFHKPHPYSKGKTIYLNAKYHKTDHNLKVFAPQERGCYFDGEKSLKFFNSYTKAHCEFECLSNYTLDVCGCVKFSMPRENLTKICEIDKTPCYLEAMRSWSSRDDSKCDCLHSCTYIEYGSDTEQMMFTRYPVLELCSTNLVAEKIIKFSTYGLENGISDFGGMLGIFFGASLISFIEIFYFCFIFVVKKLNIQIETSGSSNIQDEISSESTFHGIQFIFKASLHKVLRGFWTITFILMLSFGIIYARGNYLKLTVYPETALKINRIPIEEIPFPAISICGDLFAKKNLTMKPYNYFKVFKSNQSIISELDSEKFYYFLANIFWYYPHQLKIYLKAWNKFTLNVSDPWMYRTNIDLSPYLNKSHLEVEDHFLKCEIGGVEFDCQSVIRRVLTFKGICYSFNMQNFHSIFSEEISRNYDSYGRYEEEQDFQWSLDHGFVDLDNSDSNKGNEEMRTRSLDYDSINKAKTLLKASVNNKVSLYLKIPIDEFKNRPEASESLFIHSPDEILSSTNNLNLVWNKKIKLITFSASTTRSDESLRKFKPENRGCYFQDERKLQFFKTYTKSNCEFECLANYTLETCGCVSFLQLYNNSAKFCNSPHETACYYFFALQDFPEISDRSPPCGCLPTCNRIEYKMEEESFDKNFKEFKSTHYITQIKMEFVNSMIYQTEVFVSYHILNFITDVGGLLGLFLGCSMISFFELVYYPVKFLADKMGKKNRVEILNDESRSDQNSGSEVLPINERVFNPSLDIPGTVQ